MPPSNAFFATEPAPERAFLVGVDLRGHQRLFSMEDSLEELARLAETAGAVVVGRLIQRVSHPSRAYYLGKGRLANLAALREEADYTLVVVDDELSPMQQRNLENALQVKVIDRTALILDIFARRAQTKEGRLQVELAQAQYLLPRLAGQWSHLERLGGGIGTRGPGEAQIETDRRQVRRHIQRLRQQLEQVRRQRALHRQERQRHNIPVVALVGYTNAGKSTLFNALSQAEAFVEDKLFATLDPTTRRIALPSGQEVLITDTVGFIQKLPPDIVAAFRATLEELEAADIILHVVDITHENAAEQSQTVDSVLAELGLAERPQLLVLNKMDRYLGPEANEETLVQHLEEYVHNLAESGLVGVPISAIQGWGLSRLLDVIAQELNSALIQVNVLIPYQEGALAHLFRQAAVVDQQEFRQDGVWLQGRLSRHLLNQFRPYLVNGV